MGFAVSAFAMTQGEFQPSTRRGLFSLLLACSLLAILVFSGVKMTHINLPPNT